jgi:hypothetical protein
MAPVPEKILRLVSRGYIEFSGKGYQQLFAGPYDEDDVKNAILFGTVIKKERDETKVAKYKYTIIGPALDGAPLYCCGKIRQKGSGEEYFIITFHGDRS